MRTRQRPDQRVGEERSGRARDRKRQREGDPAFGAHAQIGGDDTEHERDERAEVVAMCRGTEIAGCGADEQQREQPAPANVGRKQ